MILLMVSECLFANAQNFEQQVADAYPPFFDLHERGFKITPGIEFNKPGKNTSYKIQYLEKAKGIWINQDSVVVFYDSKQHVSCKLHYGIGSKGRRKTIKQETNYDANGKPEATTGYAWNNAESRWQGVSKKQYQIEPDKNLFSEQTKSWNSKSNTWVYGDKNIYSYDSYGNETVRRFQRWDSATNGWIDGHVELKTYDSFRHLSSERRLFWNREINGLKEAWLFNYTSDSSGKELTHYWQNGTNYCWKDSTFYDSLNRPVEKRAYAWRYKEDRWVFFGRTLWTYEVVDGGKKSGELEWVRVPNTDSVALGIQTFRAYDSENNMISETIMRNYNTYVKPIGQGWFVESYDSAVYDNDNRIMYLYGERWSGSDVIRVFFYDKPYNADSEDENDNEPGISSAILYPNPSANATVNLKIYEDSNCSLLINILDVSGKNIASETRRALKGTNTLLISHPGLSVATYYVEVINQNTGKKNSFKWVVE